MTKHKIFKGRKLYLIYTGTTKLGGGGAGGVAAPLAFYQEGQGGEGGLLIKGKYLLLIERIRSCYYRTI